MVAFLPAYGVFILSTLAVSSALQLSEPRSIADFRRVSAALFAGSVFWLVCLGAGVTASAFGVSNGVGNSVLFGAFASAGLSYLILNGAFSRNSILSVGLAWLYPFSCLLLLVAPGFPTGLDPVAPAAGAISFVLIGGSAFLLRRKKTSRGHDALSLFRAFMKTWVAGSAGELEAIIADHSEEATVTTKVLRFNTKAGDFLIVLPGVHPGPFHPIGSYDLPGEIARVCGDLGRTMTLHRPGGHERNLATRAMTAEFAKDIGAFAKEVKLTTARAAMKGPTFAKIGKASASSISFSNDALLTISFAPLGSDDLSAGSEEALWRVGTAAGFDLSVVDAHNSIDHQQESPDVDDQGWKALLERLRVEKDKPIRLGYSHSSEVGLTASEDITENGVTLFLFATADMKGALVLADANNAVPQLRAKVGEALSAAGFTLIEICTSDSHNLAARGLTVARGYKALGEETPVESIAKLVVDMAKLAEGKLEDAAYGAGKLESRVKLFGSRALEEFAKITQESSSLSRSYFRLATPAVAVLLGLAVVF